MNEFNSIEWINNLSPEASSFTYTDLEPILSFSLIWNLFETIVCHRRADLGRIQADVNRCYEGDLLKIEDFEQSLQFFKERYTEHGDINEFHERLRLRDEQHIRLVKDVLEGR